MILEILSFDVVRLVGLCLLDVILLLFTLAGFLIQTLVNYTIPFFLAFNGLVSPFGPFKIGFELGCVL